MICDLLTHALSSVLRLPIHIDFCIVATCIIFGLIILNRIPTASDADLKIIRDRLGFYAGMYKCSQKGQIISGMLSRAEHEILLGILKKVEAKNSSLTTVWGIVSSMEVAFLFSSRNSIFVQTSAGVLLLTLPFLVASVFGMRQVDQADFERLKARWPTQQLAEKMQRELISDLIMKEAMFGISRTGALLFLPVVVVLVACIGVFAPHLLLSCVSNPEFCAP